MLLVGCFGAHGVDDAEPAGDGGTDRDARPILDARSPSRDARVADGGSDLGPAGACTCVEDSVCGEPPPFGCGQGVCVFEESCGVGIRDEGCGPGARCDPTTLECATEPAVVDIELHTDYVPVAEFDGVAVSVDGAIVARHAVSADAPYLEGVHVASFGTVATEASVGLTLYRGCVVVSSRRIRLDSIDDGIDITMIVTR